MVKLGSLSENDIQGLIRTAPHNGVSSLIGGIGTEVDGCEWEMCESRATARLAPAESPVRRMFCGGILRSCRTWVKRNEACWSCRG